MCDRVGVMARGRLVAEGRPAMLRGDGNRLRLEVDDARRALVVLEGIDGVRDAEANDATIRVRLEGAATSAGVNAALVQAGIGVRAVVPERDTLEDVFLSLVGDDDGDLPGDEGAERVDVSR